MCTILFSYLQHPRYSLVLVANRDEFYNRKTRVAGIWQDLPDVLAGKDEVGGGTWIGVNRQGKWSALTNYRVPFDQLKLDGKSRGKLTLDFLTTSDSTESYLQRISSADSLYNGYNLLLGSPTQLAYYSNMEGQARNLTAGVYGLSNHLLDTPWFKVEKGVKELKDITQQIDFNPYDLIDMMQNSEKAPPTRLPNTGVPVAWEHELSSLFIEIPNSQYGTCCTTVLLIDYQQNVRLIEKNYAPERVGIVQDLTFHE